MRITPNRDKNRRRYFDKVDKTVEPALSNPTTPDGALKSSLGRNITPRSTASNHSTSKSTSISPVRSLSTASLSPTAVTPLSPPPSSVESSAYASTSNFSVESPMSSSYPSNPIVPEVKLPPKTESTHSSVEFTSVPPSTVNPSKSIHESTTASISAVIADAPGTDPESIVAATVLDTFDEEPKEPISVDSQNTARDSYSYPSIYAPQYVEPLDDPLPTGINSKRGSNEFAESNPLYLSPTNSTGGNDTSASTAHYTTPNSVETEDKFAIFSPAATAGNPLSRRSPGGLLSAIANHLPYGKSNGVSPKVLSWDKSINDDSEREQGANGSDSNDKAVAPSSLTARDELESLKRETRKNKYENLHELLQAFDEDIDMVKLSESLMKNPNKAKEIDGIGRVPLHYACLMPRSKLSKEIVLLLLRIFPAGLFIRDTTEQCFSPFHHYVAHGIREEEVLELIGSIIELADEVPASPISGMKFDEYYPYGTTLLTSLLAMHASTTEDAADTLPSKIEKYEIVRECVLQVIALFPYLAQQQDQQDGFYPLHDAMVLECEAEIVLALIEACPDAVKVCVPYDEERGGGFPLHDALRKGYDIQVIKMMVEIYPEATLKSECVSEDYCGKIKKGNSVLHLALKYEHYVNNIFTTISDRKVSVDANAKSQPLYRIIELLLTNHHQPHLLLQECDADKNLPLHTLFLHHGSTVNLPLLELFIGPCPKTLGIKNKFGFLPLHIAVKSIGKIQKTVVWKLIDVYPPAIQEMSVDGSLPLHVAVAHCSAISNIGKIEESKMIDASMDLLSLLLHNYPDGISAANIFSYLPLHIAIINHVPMTILEMILSHFPSGAEQRVKYGDSALHLSISAKSSLDVIRLIYDTYPQAVEMMNAYGNLPLHYALLHRCKVEIIQYLLIVSTNALTISHPATSTTEKNLWTMKAKNVYGNVPLHIALIQQAPLIVVQAILLLHVEVAAIKNNQGLLPIHVALTTANTSHDIIHTLISTYPQGCMIRLGQNDELYENLPLHAYLLHNVSPSLSVVRLLVTTYPNAIKEKCGTSTSGLLLPLHIAVRRSLSLDIINYLVEAYPESISVRTGSGNGNSTSQMGDLPLHLALSQSLLSWDCIYRIIELYPLGLREANDKGEYPLHLAAMRLFDKVPQQPALAPERMHTFYEILAAEPEVAGCGNYQRDLCLHIILNSFSSSLISERYNEVVARVVKVFPDSVIELDHSGRLPLVLAIEHGAPLPVLKLLSDLTPDLLTVNVKVPILYQREKSIKNGLIDQEEQITLLALALLQPLLSIVCDDDFKISSERVQLIVSLNPTAIALLSSVTYNIPMHIAAYNHVHLAQPLEVLRTFHTVLPSGAQSANTSSHLPLHEALIGGRKRTIFDVIDYLIKIYPESIYCKDDEGNLPLHLAIFHECSLPVITLLLHAFPGAAKEKNVFNRFPIHIALKTDSCSSDLIKILLQEYPDAALIPDCDENLPLHLAMSNSSFLHSERSVEMVEWLMQCNNGAVQEKNGKGYLPIHFLCEHPCPADNSCTTYSPEKIITISQLLISTYPASCEVRNVNHANPFHLLLQSQCFVDLMGKMVKMILNECPKSATISDANGKLPLHLACQNYCGVSVPVDIQTKNNSEDSIDHDNEHTKQHPKVRGVPLSALEDIIVAFPDGIVTTMKNGFLPLYLAIESHSSSSELIDVLLSHEIPAFSNGKSILEQRHVNGLLSIQWALANRASIDVLQSLLSSHPNTIQFLSDEGYSSLSLAILHRCSYEVVSFVLNLDPLSISRKVGEAGNLPLHLAVLSKESSLEVIRILVSVFQQGIRMQNNDGNLALHLAVISNSSLEVVQMLTMIYSEGCGVLNDSGNLPLHLAVENGAKVEVIELLAATYSNGLLVKNREGLRPVDIAVQKGACGFGNQLVIEVLRRSEQTIEHDIISAKKEILNETKDHLAVPPTSIFFPENTFESLHPYLLRSILIPSNSASGSNSSATTGSPSNVAQQSPTHGLLHHSLPSTFLLVDYQLMESIRADEDTNLLQLPHRRVDQVLSYLNKLSVFVECIHEMIVADPGKYFLNNTVIYSTLIPGKTMVQLSTDDVLQAFHNVFQTVFNNSDNFLSMSTTDRSNALLKLNSGVNNAVLGNSEVALNYPPVYLYLVDEWSLRPIYQTVNQQNDMGINLTKLFPEENSASSPTLCHVSKMSLFVYMLLMVIWLHKLSTRSVAVCLRLLGVDTADILAVLFPTQNKVEGINSEDIDEKLLLLRLDLQEQLINAIQGINEKVEMAFDCFDRLIRVEKRQTMVKLCSKALKDFQELIKHKHSGAPLSQDQVEAARNSIVDNQTVPENPPSSLNIDLLSLISKVETIGSNGRKYVWLSADSVSVSRLRPNSSMDFVVPFEGDEYCLFSNYWKVLEKLKLRKLMQVHFAADNNHYFTPEEWEHFLSYEGVDDQASQVAPFPVIRRFCCRRYSIRAVIEVIQDICDVLFGKYGHNVASTFPNLHRHNPRKIFNVQDFDEIIEGEEDKHKEVNFRNKQQSIDLLASVFKYSSCSMPDGKVFGSAIICVCLSCYSTNLVTDSLPACENGSNSVNLMQILNVDDLDILLQEKEKHLLDSYILTTVEENARPMSEDRFKPIPRLPTSSQTLLSALIAGSVMLKWLPAGVVNILQPPHETSSSHSKVAALNRKLLEVAKKCELQVINPFSPLSGSAKRCEDSLHKYLMKFGILSKG